MTEKYIARSTQIAARMLGGEMMVMSVTDSTFFTLNEVATVIWQAADGHTPLSTIISQKICEQFDIDKEHASRDAEQFVNDLAQHGILLVSDTPIEQSSAASPGAQ
jgi:hypothetical protein